MKTTIHIITIVFVIGFAAACAKKETPPPVKTATSTETYRPHGK